ncbi:MAG TPA: hypothetical protein VLB86_11230 [Gaiellaceae bacterium]|nr:hypothetical protein [Gaiellaceae bacterium]
MSEPGRQPSPEEVVEALRAMKVADLLQSTIFTLAQLGFAKLDESTRDLGQARLAIEALRALLPVAEESLGDDLARDLRSTVANLQLAYAAAAGAVEPAPASEPEGEPEPEGGPEPEREPELAAEEDAEPPAASD